MMKDAGYRVLTCWPSERRPFGSVAITSPFATPDVISIWRIELLTEGDDSLLDAIVFHGVDPARAGNRFDGRRGHQQRRSRIGLTDERRGEEAGLQPRVAIRRNRLDGERALVRPQRRRHELDRGRELLARIRVDGEPHLLADLDQRYVLFGHRQLDAQRIDSHDRGDARTARDVVADAHQPFGHESRQRRPDRRVGDRLAGERDASACALERAVQLVGQILLGLVLLPRQLELRAALVELALRDDLLLDERPHAVELRLGEVERGLGVHHVGDLHPIERLPSNEAELCFNLRRVGVRLLQLGGGLRRRDANEECALSHARATLDGGLDHTAGGFGADFRLRVRHERARHAQIPIDRPAFDRGGRNGQWLGSLGGPRRRLRGG